MPLWPIVPFKTIGVIRTRGRLICTGDVNSIAGAVQARRDLQNVESSTTVKLTARAASAVPAASFKSTTLDLLRRRATRFSWGVSQKNSFSASCVERRTANLVLDWSLRVTCLTAHERRRVHLGWTTACFVTPAVDAS